MNSIGLCTEGLWTYAVDKVFNVNNIELEVNVPSIELEVTTPVIELEVIVPEVELENE